MVSLLVLWFFSWGKIFAQNSTNSANIATPSMVITSTPTTISQPTLDPTDARFQQYKTDYLFNRDIYNQSYLDYTTKKQVHTRYGTIITQKEKLEATRSSLIARNTMLRTYLLALRTLLDKYQSQNPTETEKLKIDLSKWEAWLQEQNSVVNSLLNPDDFSKNAQDFKEKYIQIQVSIYSALVQHQANLELITLQNLQDLKSNIEKTGLKPEGQQPLSEIGIKSDYVISNIKSAIDATQAKQYSQNFNNFYSESRLYLLKAKTYLQEINQNLQGLVLKYLNPSS